MHVSLRSTALLIRPGLLLFLTVWLVYGLVVNSDNLKQFNLQQMGVEAIVERAAFYVEGSPTPQLQPRGDVFEYGDHVYAAKQPGQFMAGAAAYFILHLFGLSYLNQFLLTSALVTWLTTGLVTAVGAVVVFWLARALARGRSAAWALGAALVFALGTIAFPYTGIAHHDAIASCFLLLAFYFVFRLRSEDPSAPGRRPAVLAGLFLGLTVTTSMLPFFMALVVVLYFLSLRRWGLVPWLVLGGLLGLAPLLAYDAINFGNPLALPNIVGNFSDTFFQPSVDNLVAKTEFYIGFITRYVPIVWVGLAALALLPGSFRREQLALAGMLAVLIGYLLNIDTVGHCQFGPRYLLPAMPYAALALVGLSYLQGGPVRFFALFVAVVAGLYSVGANLLGAMYGAMFCDLNRFAVADYLALLLKGRFRVYPLAAGLAIPLFACLFLLLVAAAARHRGEGEKAAVLPVRS